MKGNENVIESLNARLGEELTVINQYMVHAEMCGNWHYASLKKAIQGRAKVEMEHAEKLIARIIFLEGRPAVSKLNDIHIGEDVPAMLKNDNVAEQVAVQGYNESIRLAVEVGDNGTRELLSSLLTEEESHIDWIESQIDQIARMQKENYLAEQV